MTMQIARELGVPEADVVAAIPGGRAIELDVARWEELVRSFEALGKVHVICSNGAATLEAHGQFGKFSTWGGFFNVQTPSLDMHIRFQRLGRIFAVRKPGHFDGAETLSFQFFDAEGNSAFKVFLTFGGRAPTPEEIARFDKLNARFRLRKQKNSH